MFKFKSALVLAGMISAASLTGFGCSKDKMMDDSSMSSTMSADEMISKGDAMIVKGRGMKDQAMAMKDGDMMDGMSKSDMMMKGDKMMNEGMAMKKKGMEMKTHGM